MILLAVLPAVSWLGSLGSGCSRFNHARHKSGEGEPVTRLPLSEPMSPAGLTGMTGGPRILVYRLLGCSLRHRNNRYDFAAFGFGSERNLSIDEREQGV